MHWLSALLLLFAAAPAPALAAARLIRPYRASASIPLVRQLGAFALMLTAWGLAMGSSLLVLGQVPEVGASLLSCLDFAVPFLTLIAGLNGQGLRHVVSDLL